MYFKSKHRSTAGGFTLIELMVVIAIIGLLFVTLMGAMYKASETAKSARSQQLVTKIHNQIMPKWEAYQTRRLPVNPPTSLSSNVAASSFRLKIARWKLGALRELMRVEMPNNYDDVQMVSTSGASKLMYLVSGTSAKYIPNDLKTYQQQIAVAGGGTSASYTQYSQYIAKLAATNESAECLYMTVKLGSEDRDSTATAVSLADSGDIDYDNMPEFLDGWGNPVVWIRWPAGFVSDLQPIYSVGTGDPRRGGTQSPDPSNSKNVLTRDPVRHHDSFDPLNVDRWEPQTTPGPNWPFPSWAGEREHGYTLYPLVVSGGPGYQPLSDSDPGVVMPVSATATGQTPSASDPFDLGKQSCPYYYSSGSLQLGTIADSSAYRIVHSHTIGNRP
ncbi:MAG TPA: type II secretion system protein [Pirellulales bacterium]|nr:type II secretion system protein [Pirellulales bacterium]